ncbi:hypothetical protein [Nocardia sp. NPDC004123]
MALAATAATIAAPTGSTSPSSEPHGVYVYSDGWTVPAHIYVGVRYTVWASAIYTPARVNFYDNSACLGSSLASIYNDPVQEGNATVSWVPTSAGTHVLSTKQGSYEGSSGTLQVEPAPAGTTPVAQPKLDGCGGGGSFDPTNYF